MQFVVLSHSAGFVKHSLCRDERTPLIFKIRLSRFCVLKQRRFGEKSSFYAFCASFRWNISRNRYPPPPHKRRRRYGGKKPLV